MFFSHVACRKSAQMVKSRAYCLVSHLASATVHGMPFASKDEAAATESISRVPKERIATDGPDNFRSFESAP